MGTIKIFEQKFSKIIHLGCSKSSNNEKTRILTNEKSQTHHHDRSNSEYSDSSKSVNWEFRISESWNLSTSISKEISGSVSLGLSRKFIGVGADLGLSADGRIETVITGKLGGSASLSSAEETMISIGTSEIKSFQ